MKCPFCSHLHDRVVDSRESKEGGAIRRRRECLACGRRFTTYERVEDMPLMVLKKDGRREPFDRGKLMRGLVVATVYSSNSCIIQGPEFRRSSISVSPMWPKTDVKPSASREKVASSACCH